MGYNKTQKATPPGLGGWTYQGDVALGDPPAGGFYVDQTSMSSGTPTFEINVTDAKGISHLDWLQDLVVENHIVLRNRIRPSDSLILEISSNAAGAGFQTIVGTITSGNGTFLVGATYDIWTVTTADDFVVGPASSVITAIPTFTDTTGRVIGNNTTLQYDTGEVQLASTTSAIEIQERTTAPTFAADKGHIWVKDDAPNTLFFTDDLGTDHPIVPPNTVVLGEWTFGGSTLGATAVGEFETNNATLALISSIRFNASPNFGQSMLTWAGLLPQEGILYLQDISDPGGTSVTFPYRTITFPLGPGLPQFNGNILSTNGVDHGTNWSTNDYSLKIVAAAPSLDSVIISPVADNDVIVPSANPIILRDNAANITTLKVTGSNSVDQTPALEIQRDASTDVGLQIVTESFIPDDYIARWDSTTSDGMTFTTSEVVGDIATWVDETSTYTLDQALTTDPIWDPGQVYFDGTAQLTEVFGSYAADDATWILCGEWDASAAGYDYFLVTPNEVYAGNEGTTDEKITSILNTTGTPIVKSATDLTNEPIVFSVTNKHNGTDDNDKEAWIGTTFHSFSYGKSDSDSDHDFLRIGAHTAGTGCVGNMYEMIIYDRVLSPEEIASVTNELSVKWSAQTGDGLSSVSTTSTLTALSFSPNEIVPSARILEAPFTVKPETTTYAPYQGPSVLYTAGDHTGSLRGGNLVLDAGASTSGTNGIVTIGAIATEILLGKSDMPGFTITEGTDHPTDPNAGRAQLWVKSDYKVPTGSPQTKDGQVLMMTDDNGVDIELSWLAANYKPRIGAQLAFSHIEENATFAGGTAKATADSNVYFIYDHLSNMWYQSWIDAGTTDAQVTSSSDGGYTWVTAKEVDTAISLGKLSPPCTNGTNLGIAADGYFYLSTTLSATNLPASPTGTILAGAGHRGLVWSEQQSLWVTCSFSGGNGWIHTSPDGITWTDRTPAGMTTELPGSMDIAHSGWHGFTGTERIIISCGATGTMLWSSTDGGLNWTEDTTNVPTIGMEVIQWCPSVVGTSTDTGTGMGIWIGVDASSNLYYSTSNAGTYWLDSSYSARCIYRTPEFCGWGNTSINQTFYKIEAVTDLTLRGVNYSIPGVLYANGRFMHSSNEATNRTRYQWGNGVIMFDRMGDGELMIGRYGPIEPV